MTCLQIGLLLLLVSGTLSQDGFDLADAIDDLVPATPKPKDVPKVPEKPKNDDGLDLFDALGPDLDPKPNPKPANPAVNPGGGGGELDILDALGPDMPGTPKPKNPSSGDFGGGRSGGVDPGFNPNGAPEEPQEAGSGKIAGIVSAIGVALLGAASSYIAYQKKKLCFKIQGGGADPERGKGQYGQQSDPQVFSNLLRTS